MMRNALLLICMVPMVGFAVEGTADAGGLKLTDNYFTFNGVKYRRKKAEGARLGSTGIVRKPFGKAYYYERKAMPPEGFTVATFKATQVSASVIKGHSGNLGISYMGQSASATTKKLRSGELVLVKMSVDSVHNFRVAINNSKYINQVRNYSKKSSGRLVTAVWIVIRSSEAKKFKTGAKLRISAGNWKGVVGGSTTGSKSWSISKGTIFAYEFSKIVWSSSNKIADLKTDRPNW